MNNAWKFEQTKYDPRIIEKLETYNPVDLNDPHKRQIWVEFAKKFSQMKLSVEDVEGMSYDTFIKIRSILSATLGELSKST